VKPYNTPYQWIQYLTVTLTLTLFLTLLLTLTLSLTLTQSLTLTLTVRVQRRATKLVCGWQNVPYTSHDYDI